MSTGERLQKFLARSGVASRRASERLIEEGRVKVNGRIVQELGTRVFPPKDRVEIGGKIVQPAEKTYLLLYKPKGVLTTLHDPQGRPTIKDLLPRLKGLFPVGRLDFASEGLLLVTNDGDLAQKLLHPKYQVPRTYEVKVEGIVSSKEMERLLQGILLEGFVVHPSKIILIRQGKNHCWLEVTVHEGRHHEVRRLMEAVGHPVVHLRRVQFGPLNLRGLRPGDIRHLTPKEIQRLLMLR
ncbi:MAG: rRNA pseudouridine synthase [Deltaproteobacteria bacterium]|nr:rRNA pseudouridine synthase [Deltaproteobacteria bacterium]